MTNQVNSQTINNLDQKNKISASYICLLANSIGFKTSINTRTDKQNIYRITCTKSSFRKESDAIKNYKRWS